MIPRPVDLCALEDSFLAFASRAGIALPADEFRADGAIHRFHIEGDSHGSKNGAFQVWPEGMSGDGKPNGWVMDYKRGGEKEKWQFYSRDNPAPKDYAPPSPAEQQAARARREADARAATGQRLRALEYAWSVYRAAKSIEEAPDHPYLLTKGVRPVGGFLIGGEWCGLRVGEMTSAKGKKLGGLLLIPMMDVSTGRFCALHRVFPWADRESGKYPKGWTTSAGGVFPIGVDVGRGPVFVAEGIATALSIWNTWIERGEPEAPGEYVNLCTALAAMDSGNLIKQAMAIRARYPARRLLICPDADEAGERAKQACIEAGFDGVWEAKQIKSREGMEG